MLTINGNDARTSESAIRYSSRCSCLIGPGIMRVSRRELNTFCFLIVYFYSIIQQQTDHSSLGRDTVPMPWYYMVGFQLNKVFPIPSTSSAPSYHPMCIKFGVRGGGGGVGCCCYLEFGELGVG